MYDQDNYPLLYVPCYMRDISREWDKVIQLGQKYSYKKGDYFQIGHKDKAFGYIKSGMTCCYYSNAYSQKDEIRFFIGDGCLVKETFVLANFGFYVTHHKCLSDVTLYLFDKEMLFDTHFLASFPELLNNFIFSISIKSVSVQLFASILKFNTTIQKVAHYIYGFYLLNKKKRVFEPPFGQAYLAELLGISKYTINRIITKLRTEGILESYTRKKIEIGDLERLELLKSGKV